MVAATAAAIRGAAIERAATVMRTASVVPSGVVSTALRRIVRVVALVVAVPLLVMPRPIAILRGHLVHPGIVR
jgi:hypothetical protein